MRPEDFFAIIASAPRLPGAACKGRAPLFDAEDGEEAAAVALCASCSALQPCRAWFLSLPPNRRPPGVVGGLVHRRDARGNGGTITEGIAL